MEEHQFGMRNPILAGTVGLLGMVVFILGTTPGQLRAALIVGAGVLLLASIQLRTRLDQDIVVTVWPFWRRRIPLQEITQVRAVRFLPVRHFGGWGIRFGMGPFLGTVAYTMSGTRGLRLTLSHHRDLVLGSRKSQAWIHALAASGVPTGTEEDASEE